MNQLTTLLGFLAALSVATERITEIAKGFPGLSWWFSVDRKTGTTTEEFRKASVQVLALLAGTLVAYLARDPLAAQLNIKATDIHIYMYFVLGAMASGGSGIWNSALDIVREVNTQKQIATEKLKAGAGS